MLIIPTSLDTAIVLELRQPLVWAVVAYTSLTAGAYCLWEMAASAINGRGPRLSRWVWVITAVGLLAAAVFSSGAMFGPVTFNADRADWVSTSWGVVLGGTSMAAYSICVLVILVLRTTDAAQAGGSGRRLRLMGWLLGLCAMSAYGFLLAWSADMPHGPAIEDTVRAVGFILAIVAIGSLFATAAIRRMRMVRARSISV